MVEVVLAQGARTPFGDFGKSLRDTPLTDLGVHATTAAIRRAGISPTRIDHLAFGNVLPVDGDGHFISRRVALGAGLPIDSSAVTVNRACASGSEAIATIARLIMAGSSRIGIAGGGENFSRAPFVLRSSRWTPKRGPQTLEDSLDNVYRCSFGGEFMGETAELLAEENGYTRPAMDVWALESQMRARKAVESGFLARQIEPILIKEKAGERLFAQDEYIRFDATADKLAKLRPVFKAGGHVTAGNASGVTDGAAAIIVASSDAAEAEGLRPLARIVAMETVGVPPELMGAGPVPAIAKLLERQSLTVGDIDYWEINEAFAVVNIHAEIQLGIPHEKTNLYGGGMSIGHPPGATGIRMTLTAIDHLQDSGGRFAIISMCIGGGQGMATLIERL
ncbi:thiolase family protein [Sphingobium fuliginis]|jgi:acetyl-CoA acetyltransferase family protein|uniref:3-ketoacyl-CoA thiolase n=1 Tax=Sphingobium fuliginis (strain ATCC 27551) TaxID=336203 RepID=A0A292ZG95_SPHSA|nr:thiolase family protein [Sphingobium fuliginis]GAY21941.1 3-ketoacyl-CoA thiolase [Sphingobium fuliginis]